MYSRIIIIVVIGILIGYRILQKRIDGYFLNWRLKVVWGEVSGRQRGRLVEFGRVVKGEGFRFRFWICLLRGRRCYQGRSLGRCRFSEVFVFRCQVLGRLFVQSGSFGSWIFSWGFLGIVGEFIGEVVYCIVYAFCVYIYVYGFRLIVGVGVCLDQEQDFSLIFDQLCICGNGVAFGVVVKQGDSSSCD